MHPSSIAVVSIFAVILAIQVIAFHDLRHDDAYITFRYGQNLASGHGLVFNPGERLMGSTSPLFALSSGAIYAITGKTALPSVMSAIGCLAWSAQAWAIYLLLGGALGRGWALGIAMAVAAGAAESAQWVALETNAAVAFVLWAMVMAGRDRWAAAAALAALAGLVRPDAYLPAALLAGVAIHARGREVWRPAAVFLGVTLPWLVFATAWFGSPLPQSAVAKFQRVSFVDYFIHALETPAEFFLLPDASSLVTVIAWGLAAIGTGVLLRLDSRLWILPAYAIGHLLAYSFLRPFTQHTWHLYPLTLVLTVLALSAVASLVRGYPGRAGQVATALLLTLFVVFYTMRSTYLAQNHHVEYWNGARDAAYRMSSEFLVQNVRPGDVIATGEVGTLAYYSELPIYDLSGLVTANPEPISNLRAIEGLRWFLTNARFPKLPAEIRPHQVLEARGFAIAAYRFDNANDAAH